MNETAKAPEKKKALTRDQIRAALIGKRHKGNTEVVELFGIEVELHQPTLNAILEAREEEDVKKRTTDVFINYAFVPGTNELVFEDTDRQTILDWPFTDDLIKVQEVMAKLTGVDIGAVEEELKADPLEEPS